MTFLLASVGASFSVSSHVYLEKANRHIVYAAEMTSIVAQLETRLEHSSKSETHLIKKKDLEWLQKQRRKEEPCRRHFFIQ